jgi:hypothetical protein
MTIDKIGFIDRRFNGKKTTTNTLSACSVTPGHASFRLNWVSPSVLTLLCNVSTPTSYAAASGGDAAKKNECRASMGWGLYCHCTGTKTGLGIAPLAANNLQCSTVKYSTEQYTTSTVDVL